jgi:septum formation inhibitor MinC
VIACDRDKKYEKLLKNFAYAFKGDRELVSKEISLTPENAARLAQNTTPSAAQNAAQNAIGAAKTQIFTRPVRSGERIESRGDAHFFARINAGAEIFVAGNCFIYAPLYGQCFASGEIAIVRDVKGAGLFVFNEKPYESVFFTAPKRFFYNGGVISCEDDKP